VRWMFGEEIVGTTVLTPRKSKNGGELQDPLFLLLEMANGALIDVEISVNIRYGYDIRGEVVGEEGTVALGESSSIVVRKNNQYSGRVPEDWRERFIQAYDVEFQEWIDGVRDGGTYGPSSWDGYAAAVVSGCELGLRCLGGLRVRFGRGLLDRMLRLVVAAFRPVPDVAEGEHPGVLAGAVVVDLVRRPSLLEAELEVVLGRVGLGEEGSRGRQLLRGGAVRRAGDRDVLVGQVVSRPDERQRLDRLAARAHEAHEPGIARLLHDRPVPNGHRVHPVHRLDDPVPANFDDQRLGHGRSLVTTGT